MQKMEFKNLSRSRSYQSLKKNPRGFSKRSIHPANIEKRSLPAGGGFVYNYAGKGLEEGVLERLKEMAAEQEVVSKYKALHKGIVMNTGEKRMVLHHLLRSPVSPVPSLDEKHRFYRGEQKRIADFARRVHEGDLRGSTGKRFNTVVQIGIGGSDLGPKALYLALENFCELKMKAHFISNVDPDDAVGVLNQVDFEKTLFVIVSKSGTTQETLTNQNFVLEKMKNSGTEGLVPGQHILAVTSKTSPMAESPDYLESFYIDDFIGGRYSSCSAVGGTVLSLAFGGDVFAEILEGAHEADVLALEEDPFRNPSLLDALIGVYERNILNYPYSAILPYSQALSRFPAHLQQLDMESNGKQVNRFGKPISYSTGPVIFGEPGTNGQHSFYQLLHQGTDIVPLQFIGFSEAQMCGDTEYEGATSQKKLKANLAAQITAFTLGADSPNKNKFFPGKRPVSLLLAKRLTPSALGALLAHFENKVMFQGFLWNINSFDQEGVQLGKRLANKVLADSGDDPVLSGFFNLLR